MSNTLNSSQSQDENTSLALSMSRGRDGIVLLSVHGREIFQRRCLSKSQILRFFGHTKRLVVWNAFGSYSQLFKLVVSDG